MVAGMNLIFFPFSFTMKKGKMGLAPTITLYFFSRVSAPFPRQTRAVTEEKTGT
jgi:hypothetical protein